MLRLSQGVAQWASTCAGANMEGDRISSLAVFFRVANSRYYMDATIPVTTHTLRRGILGPQSTSNSEISKVQTLDVGRNPTRRVNLRRNVPSDSTKTNTSSF